jgi:cobalamin biosynthesis protein CobD/CbiB
LPLNLYDAWYFIMGFLLANGVPHFVFGRAGKLFRSPFGQRSPPKVNVAWGCANFLLATIIGLALAYLGLYDSYSLILLLLGFWLMVLNFGFSIKRFLNE